MRKSRARGVNRREFMIQSGLAAGAVAGGMMGTGCTNSAPPGMNGATHNGRGVSLYCDARDELVTARPTGWAIARLEQALKARNVQVSKYSTVDEFKQSRAGDLRIAVLHTPEPHDAGDESIVIGKIGDAKGGIAVTGTGVRGIVYALTDAADRVNVAPDPLEALSQLPRGGESPANKVRSVMRMFSSKEEDIGWYNDRTFWRDYLDMLVTERFNRFNLSFGLGYDFARELTDTYLYYAYPFLISVPGYDVRATNLSDAERDRNLEMLRFISDETVARGMEFQLGIWTHAYVWQNSPNANHVIEGLTDQTQPTYSRDALTLILKECPNISGVTLRIHGESGVVEGSYDFWKIVFDGVARANRNVRLDLHSKGIDQPMIDNALATGLPLTVTTKFWAEHMGLPYHQAAIRPTELPTRARGATDLMALSTGSRSFTRYGYGDLLYDDRKFGLIHRVWPGTQRMLLWGDPVFASAYGRVMSFCGSLGCEFMEPLSFKGRKGSGIAGGRDAYADSTLRAPGADFEKYRYTYRLWGRMLYNPDTTPDVWRRQLNKDYGADIAIDVEDSLASASRILPLFTSAHLPSAANNHYWPEMYVNMPIVALSGPDAPYGDTPTPRRFGTVSPLDPQLFSRIEDYIQQPVDKNPGGKYSPAEVALALENLANEAATHLADAKAKARSDSASLRRAAIDVSILASLGRFYANKLRAGMYYAIFDGNGKGRDALTEAIKSYRAAKQEWEQVIATTRNVYVADVSYGIAWYQRGNWSDRLPAIDQDIAAMEALLPNASADPTNRDLLLVVTTPASRPEFAVDHTPPARFASGFPLQLALNSRSGSQPIASVQCHYRRTHQAEPWNVAPMQNTLGGWSTSIAGAVVESRFPVQYYFELTDSAGHSTLYPGFNETCSNQPYFVVRSV